MNYKVEVEIPFAIHADLLAEFRQIIQKDHPDVEWTLTPMKGRARPEVLSQTVLNEALPATPEDRDTLLAARHEDWQTSVQRAHDSVMSKHGQSIVPDSL